MGLIGIDLGSISMRSWLAAQPPFWLHTAGLTRNMGLRNHELPKPITSLPPPTNRWICKARPGALSFQGQCAIRSLRIDH